MDILAGSRDFWDGRTRRSGTLFLFSRRHWTGWGFCSGRRIAQGGHVPGGCERRFLETKDICAMVLGGHFGLHLQHVQEFLEALFNSLFLRNVRSFQSIFWECRIGGRRGVEGHQIPGWGFTHWHNAVVTSAKILIESGAFGTVREEALRVENRLGFV